MGGQACVFYGAAQFSKHVDLTLLASEQNFARLHQALDDLHASRIAIPRFDPALLARGHAVHFRCHGGLADGVRIDLMTRLRDLADFQILWSRRTTITGEDGEIFDLLSVQDLVQAKKTQRAKDWPIIDALVEGHYRSLAAEPSPERIKFWLSESRTPERLTKLVAQFPEEARARSTQRPLLGFAFTNQSEALREALDAEARVEQTKDRAYWAPLKAEFEAFRKAERADPKGSS
jgi:hypothetical protein